MATADAILRLMSGTRPEATHEGAKTFCLYSSNTALHRDCPNGVLDTATHRKGRRMPCRGLFPNTTKSNMPVLETESIRDTCRRAKCSLNSWANYSMKHREPCEGHCSLKSVSISREIAKIEPNSKWQGCSRPLLQMNSTTCLSGTQRVL